MSMFSTRNGLYEKARKQFKISDGIKLFTYSFYKANRESVQVEGGVELKLHGICGDWSD